MSKRKILEALRQGKVSPDAEVSQYLAYHGEGHFHVWRVSLSGRANEWIVKSPTHEDEKRMVFRDLALGRLGRLFDPPITPEALLAAVPPRVIKDLVCRADDQGEPRCDRAAAAPTVFATHKLGRAYKGTLQNLDLESLARVVAFASWVDATDSEYVDGQDGRGYSIDHADSLHGASNWREGEDAIVEFGDLARLDDGSLRDPALYERFLAEISELWDGDLVQSFVGIPPDWGGSMQQRAHEAAYLRARKPGVERAVASYTRR